MAHPSSTSSTKERCLYQFLEEQQEPFFLDIYLLEKGYSTRVLDKTPTICWSGNEKRALQKLTSCQFKSKRREGCLKGTVSKLLHIKYAKRELNRDDDDCKRDQEFEISERFCEKEIKMADVEQLSPVSVFDLGSYKSSPVSQSEEEKLPKTFILDPKMLDIFKELLEAAYTPEFEKNLKPLDQDKPKKRPLGFVIRENQEKIWDSEGQILRSEKKKETLNGEKKESDLLENQIVELEKLAKIISEDILETPRWSDFSSQIREIATEIEDAILYDITLSLFM